MPNQETCTHNRYHLKDYTCADCVKLENQILKAQIKMKEERIAALVKNIDGLTNLTNRLLFKFKTQVT